jgi:fucose 4-O-acetylase-like acetyltransferase
LPFIDFGKTIGILLVTFIHIANKTNTFTKWASLYKLTIFFIITGFIIEYKRSLSSSNESFFVSILSLFLSLLVPYFIFSALSIIKNVAFATSKSESFSYLLKLTFSFRGIDTLWFLPVLFLGEVLFRLTLIPKKRYITILLMAISLISIFCLNFTLLSQISFGDTVFLYNFYVFLTKSIFSFFFIGVGFFLYKPFMSLHSAWFKIIIGLLCICSSIGLSFFDFSIDINNLKFGGNYIYCLYIGGILASIGWLLLFSVFPTTKFLRMLTYFGRNSLILMATQLPLYTINDVSREVLRVFHFPTEESNLEYYFEALIVMVAVLIFTIPIIELINRYYPFVIGKKYPGPIIRTHPYFDINI